MQTGQYPGSRVRAAFGAAMKPAFLSIPWLFGPVMPTFTFHSRSGPPTATCANPGERPDNNGHESVRAQKKAKRQKRGGRGPR